jgi:single-stranded-DNA-specific exonuclease
MMKNITATSMGTMGRENNHLRLSLKSGLRGVGFGLGSFYTGQFEIQSKMNVEDYPGIMFICRLDMNEFRGNKTLQLQIKDIKLDPLWQVEAAKKLVKAIVMEENPKQSVEALLNENSAGELELSVVMIRNIYAILKKNQDCGVPIAGGSSIISNISPYHLLMSCEILREAGLLAYGIRNDIVFSKIIPANKKKDIQNTKLMIKLEKITSDE